MSEDWFDVAYIHPNEAILHGRAKGDHDVRMVLGDGQKIAIEDMNERHQREMQALLRSMAG